MLADAAVVHGVHNLIFEDCANTDNEHLRHLQSLLRVSVHRSVSQSLAQNAASLELFGQLAAQRFRCLAINVTIHAPICDLGLILTFWWTRCRSWTVETGCSGPVIAASPW